VLAGARGASLQRLATNERVARYVGFWWGFAEGIFFFIVPDVYITFAALFSLRAACFAWLTSIAGSMVAVALLYACMTFLHIDYLAFLVLIPGISSHLLQRVGDALASNGLPYTPLLILAGVPLKVFAALALSSGLSLGTVLLWTAFARFVRIAPTVALFAVMRLLLGRRIDANPAGSSVALGLSWLAFYTFYFVHMSRP
jgi:hypothetical protein